MNKLIFISLLLLNGISWAQRPLPIEVLRPKVDLLKIKADNLYRHVTLTEKLIEEGDSLNLNYNSYIIYPSNDTLIGLLINAGNDCVLELHYNNYSQPLYRSSFERKLSKREQKQLDLKTSFQIESNKSIYEKKEPKDCYFLQVLLPFEKGYHFYILSLTKMDSIIPFGNDYLFVFDETSQLKSWEKLYNHIRTSVKKEDYPRGSGKINMLWLPREDFQPVPREVDILKFRLYYKNISLNECIAICNKREFTYNAPKNKISIKLFPIEEK